MKLIDKIILYFRKNLDENSFLGSRIVNLEKRRLYNRLHKHINDTIKSGFNVIEKDEYVLIKDVMKYTEDNTLLEIEEGHSGEDGRPLYKIISFGNKK